MANPITALALIKLAPGKTEADLLAASHIFQKDFAGHQPGLLRRELVRKSDGDYLDILHFASMGDMQEIIEREKNSPACHAFFSVMDTGADAKDDGDGVEIYHSLATYE